MRREVQREGPGSEGPARPPGSRKPPPALTVPGPGWGPEDIVWSGDYEAHFTGGLGSLYFCRPQILKARVDKSSLLTPTVGPRPHPVLRKEG